MALPNLAVFISPHGYGHASRASAILKALSDQEPAVHFEIFTKVPRWFFEETLPGTLGYHSVTTDLGMVQSSAMQEDLTETLARLESFLPFKKEQIDNLAEQLIQLKCQLVLCDISPLGIEVAQKAKIPSVLIENFTWDWIYERYVAQNARFQYFADLLKTIYKAADWHVLTEPFCQETPADLITSPVSRKALISKQVIRERLNIGQDQRLVLISMGGIPTTFSPEIGLFQEYPELQFVFLTTIDKMERHQNLLFLPHHSSFYHPDLLQASDVVIGKLGYSTIAETYHAGLPFGYFSRPTFPESPPLENFVKKHLPSKKLSAGIETFAWLKEIPDLLKRTSLNRQNLMNGSQQVAEFLYRLLIGS
ncbi:hypothetical protein WDW89_17715 [Deltaproteobacteria bacterium TL4]